MDIYVFFHSSVLYLIGLSLIVGLLNIGKYWKTNSSLILLYLLVLFVVELVGLKMIGENNQWMYNLSGIVELSILSVMFYRAVLRPKSILFIQVIIMSCSLFLVVDAIFMTDDFMKFWTFAFGFISLGVSMMCVVYLLELATTEDVVHQNRILLYWVAIGLLIYQLVSLPVTVLTHNLEEIGNEDNIQMIQWLAGITMYFCFIIGFIWTRKQYNS